MVAQTQDNAKPVGKAQSIFALLQPLKFVPVGWSEKHQQYRKCIGTRADPHGVVRPRIFWLGRDKAEAEFTASSVVLSTR